MPIRYAVADGSFNDVIWSDSPTGTADAQFAPTAADVVMANGHTVSVSSNTAVTEWRTDAKTP